MPGHGNLGVLQAGALEESNVDLTAELVNMITAQRDYQANAQTIKTEDQIMQTHRQPALNATHRGLRRRMDRLIYLSMSGAKATMQRQDTLANNLANVSTVGFRAELAAFRAVPVQGSGASTRVFALEIDARLRRHAGHGDGAPAATSTSR